MKNLLLVLVCFLFVGITTTSCKKDWNCQCITTDNTDTVMYQLKELRKNDAKTRCDEYADVIGTCTIETGN